MLNSGVVFNNSIYAVGINDDGSFIIGGEFSEIGGVTRNYLLKLNPGGTESSSFYANLGDGFDTTVLNIAIQDNGKILAGGWFTQLDGNSRKRLVRLNSDGTEDTTFYNNLTSAGDNSGLNDGVVSIKIQSDGKILVGGYFTTLNGSSRKSLIRLNSDGSEDTAFYSNFTDTGDNTGLNSAVIAVGYDSVDGSIYLGGNFTTYNGTSTSKILKIGSNGLPDETFNINVGSAFNGDVFSIFVQSDQKILIGGSFTTFDGDSRKRLIRLNSDGTEDESFYTNFTSEGNNSGLDGSVFTVKQIGDDSILVGGQFTNINGESKNYFVKLNGDGSIDNNFKTANGFFQQIRFVDAIDDFVIIAGEILSYQSVDVSKIIKLYNIETPSGYTAREVHTGDEEVLLLK
ncbi:hypothetical protein EBU71_21505, partial [bacterium]|nr:hypothetical protein [Candidatus Elulimicrobium humile]